MSIVFVESFGRKQTYTDKYHEKVLLQNDISWPHWKQSTAAC